MPPDTTSKTTSRFTDVTEVKNIANELQGVCYRFATELTMDLLGTWICGWFATNLRLLCNGIFFSQIVRWTFHLTRASPNSGMSTVIFPRKFVAILRGTSNEVVAWSLSYCNLLANLWRSYMSHTSVANVRRNCDYFCLRRNVVAISSQERRKFATDVRNIQPPRKFTTAVRPTTQPLLVHRKSVANLQRICFRCKLPSQIACFLVVYIPWEKHKSTNIKTKKKLVYLVKQPCKTNCNSVLDAHGTHNCKKKKNCSKLIICLVLLSDSINLSSLMLTKKKN